MYYEHHRYVGKVCVVTGGANGLGLNLVNRLVEEGAFVAALDLEKETLDKEFAGQEKVFGVPCDVSSKTSVDAAVAALKAAYAGLVKADDGNGGNNNQGNNNKGDNVNKPGTPNNTNAAGKNNTTNKGTVKTGDTAPFMAMIVTILAAAGVIFGTVAQKTRRRRNRK